MLDRIQVFTRGCARSKIVEMNLKKAVAQMDLGVEVEVTSDPSVIKTEDILSFPSVKINGELKVDGDFTSADEFKEILSAYLQE